jgi:hypothetical protein
MRFRTHGDVLTAISDRMVGLLREFYGRGPTRAKSYYEDDLRSADFFDVEHYPQVRFDSDTAELDNSTLSVRGQLHAAAKRIGVELHATVRAADESFEVEAVTQVDHGELGMTWSPLRIMRPYSKLIIKGQLVREPTAGQ